MCSELAKVEVQLNLQALSTPEKAAEQLDEVPSDPLNAEAMKVARPGLPTNSTTLQRGDRLGTAAERGDTQQVKKLVSKGADPNFRNAASGVTPLGVASERGHVDVVKVLLKARADVEAQTLEGFRPLHIAAQFGQEAVVRELIGARADVHSRCPLQARARNSPRAILRTIRRAQYSPRNSPTRGSTPAARRTPSR